MSVRHDGLPVRADICTSSPPLPVSRPLHRDNFMPFLACRVYFSLTHLLSFSLSSNRYGTSAALDQPFELDHFYCLISLKQAPDIQRFYEFSSRERVAMRYGIHS